MENHIVLNPLRKQLFQVEQPAQSRPRVSFTRAMWVRFVVWSSKATLRDVKNVILRLAWCVGLPFGVIMPTRMGEAVYGAFLWHHGALPMIALGFAVLRYWRPVYRWHARRRLLKNRPENQYTFQGAPIGQLVDFLKGAGSFKRDAAIKALRISQPQYARIADSLKQAGILVHGENNAHVMREIGRTLLTHQLEDLAEGRYPRYKYDEERDLWYERDGAAASFILNREFEQRKMEEKQERRVERRKREVERLDSEIEEREELLQPSAFSTIMAA